MKCLVTGATGFVGATLVKRLLDIGNEVHVICRKDSNLWRIKDVISSIVIHYDDLTIEKETRRLLNKEKFNYIFHLAAYGGHYYERDIKKIFDTNLIILWNIVSVSKEIGIDGIINTSSSSEYGEKELAMKEDMVLKPNNIYGATKAASTIICSTLARENNIPLTTLRLFSPYGYFDDKNRLISNVIINGIKNKDIQISSVNSKRDYIFIDDVVDVYIKLLTTKNITGEVYNIGSGVEYTTIDIVNKILKLLNSSSKLYFITNIERQYEPQHWVSDIGKIKNDLNWNPKVEIDEGLIRTIEWFKENINLYE